MVHQSKIDSKFSPYIDFSEQQEQQETPSCSVFSDARNNFSNIISDDLAGSDTCGSAAGVLESFSTSATSAAVSSSGTGHTDHTGRTGTGRRLGHCMLTPWSKLRLCLVGPKSSGAAEGSRQASSGSGSVPQQPRMASKHQGVGRDAAAATAAPAAAAAAAAGASPTAAAASTSSRPSHGCGINGVVNATRIARVCSSLRRLLQGGRSRGGSYYDGMLAEAAEAARLPYSQRKAAVADTTCCKQGSTPWNAVPSSPAAPPPLPIPPLVGGRFQTTPAIPRQPTRPSTSMGKLSYSETLLRDEFYETAFMTHGAAGAWHGFKRSAGRSQAHRLPSEAASGDSSRESRPSASSSADRSYVQQQQQSRLSSPHASSIMTINDVLLNAAIWTQQQQQAQRRTAHLGTGNNRRLTTAVSSPQLQPQSKPTTQLNRSATVVVAAAPVVAGSVEGGRSGGPAWAVRRACQERQDELIGEISDCLRQALSSRT
ncbi:hypothetical protein PLESTB_001376700 [Pleodorina starrii]|uniref:Uncharacterized protein n=1 Tax=Pleodorina starrii TaxID=330485 RepID=A0A9W6BUF7_9CHLO|nr:hypothetical protein PLESTB_001376700 [Pleodorina starrii]